jgi:glycosyltransferase involved in cell wall biosynthesis
MPVQTVRAADVRNGSPIPSRASGAGAPVLSRAVTVAFPFQGGVIGGSHISALRLIQNLDRNHFRPLVMLHEGEGPVAELFRAEGLDFTTLPAGPPLRARIRPGIADLLRLPGRLQQMAAFLSARQVAIVHTNEGAMHTNWTLPAALCRIPHIWHHRSNPDALGLRTIAPLLASRVIAVSRFATPSPGPFSARNKTRVIYSPFDQSISQMDRSESRACIVAELDLHPQTAIVSYLGHFAERKRPDMFVRTLAAFRSQYPGRPVAGLILGHEEMPGQMAWLQRIVEECRAGDIIHFMGFRRPVETWIAGSDVLLVPAVDEPFGRTLIEAMLIGTPVVAAASGGNVEAIDHERTGVLAAPDQPGALADALASLIFDPALAARIADTAQREALNKFDTETHVRGVEAVYREVLAR